MQKREKQFATGVYFYDPHQKDQNFVIGTISIKKKEFSEWFSQQETDDKGYVRFSVKRSSNDNRPYVELDTYKMDNRCNDNF